MRKVTCWTLSAILVVGLLLAPAVSAMPSDREHEQQRSRIGISIDWLLSLLPSLTVPSNAALVLGDEASGSSSGQTAGASGSSDATPATDPDG